MTNVQPHLPSALAPVGSSDAPAANSEAAQIPLLGVASGDRIGQLLRPQAAAGGEFPAANLLQQVMAAIRQLLSMLSSGGGNAQAPHGYFQSADASSTGDPHLAFDGTGVAGATQHTRFDSMTGHRDLLHSRSFGGGLRVSTRTTQPDANGITYNRSATVTTNYGGTQVTLENDGDAYVMENGRRFNLAAGAAYNLGNGEAVTRGADGSVQVRENNAEGGSILTTLTQNGHGVDARMHAVDVELGGDLLGGGSPD